MELLPWQVLGRESRKGNLVGGDVRRMEGVEKGGLCGQEGVEKGGLCGQEGDGESCIARKISHNNEMTMTSWFFQEECVPWYPRMTPTVKVSAFLDNLSSLRQEGSYCYKLKQWRRFYVTLEGIVINLVEDVPESGGQNCLWSAGAVMARYLECSDLRNVLCGQRILELGAGAGLTSMMAALLGGDVYSTEQKSCLGYLQRNIALNPDISIHTHELFWTLSCKENEQFDIILGCDITYDVTNFEAIFHTVKLCLSPRGTLLICHDEESCPLSKRARERLRVESSAIGLEMFEIDFQDIVSERFFHPSVKLWQLSYR